jgi:hypothetical protein
MGLFFTGNEAAIFNKKTQILLQDAYILELRVLFKQKICYFIRSLMGIISQT